MFPTIENVINIILIITLLLITRQTLCTVQGMTYMDSFVNRDHKNKPGDNPCNPLYWYPRNIPEYCYNKPTIKPVIRKLTKPIPMPVPVPQPSQIAPMPYPIPSLPFPPLPVPMPPAMPPPMFPMPVPMHPVPQIPYPIIPYPTYDPAPLPFGVHIAPSNPMLPVAGIPQSQPGPLAGMVPGLPGLVTRDGGINILPFSDVYSDMLEKHKNKMIRKKLRKIIREYEHKY